jgi:hypothetical protein
MNYSDNGLFLSFEKGFLSVQTKHYVYNSTIHRYRNNNKDTVSNQTFFLNNLKLSKYSQ